MGYLNFHVVAYALIFLYAAEEFVELVALLSVEQFLNESEHLVCALCVEGDFLLCFKDGEFGCREQTSCDESQTGVLVALLCWENLTYCLLNELDQPYE